MPNVIGVAERRDREQRMLVDLNTIKKLTPDRRRGVLALISFLESPECSAGQERAIFAAIKELMTSSPVGELFDPDDAVAPEVRERVADFYQNVGKAVRLFRNLKQLTQAGLAKRARIPQPHLSRIETGEHIPTRQTLTRLAKALGTTIDRLASAGGESALSNHAPVRNLARTGRRTGASKRKSTHQQSYVAEFI